MTEQELTVCRRITEHSKRAFSSGLFTGTSGNMSYYMRAEDVMTITPTSVRYEDLLPQDMVVMKLDGTVVSGNRKPSSEWRMHAVVYQSCPDINAVFHTHSPYATAFAVTRQTIPPVLIESHLFLGGDIRCADYAKPGTREVGEYAIPALKDRGGCTLANHGVLAVGETLEQAYLRAEYIEELARIYSYAKQIGTPIVLDSL